MKKILFILFAILPVISTFSQNNLKEIKPALLVIDVQKAYIGSMDPSDMDFPIYLINAYISLFRQHDLPVIYIYHTDVKYGPPVESEAFQYIDKIQVPDDAIKVVKNYGNAFTKTDLDSILKKLDCNTIFLTGLSATACVMSTWVGGNDHDYNTFMVKDAVLSHDKEKTEMMENVLGAVSFEAIRLMVGF